MTGEPPDAALFVVSPDTDPDSCLNIAMLAAAALKFAAVEFDAFQVSCVEASPSADLTDWLLAIHPDHLGEFAEMLANGIVAAGGTQ